MNFKLIAVALLCVTCLSSTATAKEEEGLVTLQLLTPETAIELAQNTLKACRNANYQVAVAVVDRMGVTQVLLRDRFAGPHTPETARRKAWTAVSFRVDTLTLSDRTKPGTPQSGARFVTDALMIGGGVPVEAGGFIVAGVGVSGGPSGEVDDACAREGINAVLEKLEF